MRTAGNRSYRFIVLIGLIILTSAALAACRTTSPAPTANVTGPTATSEPTTATETPAPPTATPEPTLTPTPTAGPGLSELLGTPQAGYLNADLEGAAAAYNELATLYPNSGDPGIGLAEIAVRQGDVEGAQRALETAVTAEPSNFEAWHQLAVIYEQTQNYEGAANAYSQMIALQPDNANLYAARSMAEARLGDAAAAADDLTTAQAYDPYLEYAWLNTAGAAYGARAYETAADILSAGLEAYPNSPSLLVLRGKAQLVAGNAEGALESFNAAIAADERNMAANYWRGAALDALNRTGDAIAAYQQAGDIGAAAGAGGLDRGFEAMAQAARLMARSDSSAAYAYLEQKAITYGQPPAILLGYALIEYERGNPTSAAGTLSQLIEEYNFAPALYWRGKINTELGNTSFARDDLNAYLNIQPAGPEAEDAYALLDSFGG